MPLPAKTILLLFLLSSATAHAQQYGWVRVAQLGNQFTSLNAVEFADSLHGWTAQGSLNIYKTVDGGINWSPFSGSPMGVNSISMFDTLTGWCVGAQGSTGKILRTTDGGITWIDQWKVLNNRSNNGTAARTRSANTTVGRTLNFFPDTGKVVQTSNGGSSWIERTIADSIVRLTGVQFVDSLYGWMIGNIVGKILRTTDGGSSWSIISTPSISVTSFVNRSLGFGVGGYCYKTIDSGFTWTQIGRIELPGSDLAVADMSFADSTCGWACGFLFYQGANRGAIYGTTDGGVTWNAEHIGTGVDERINAMIMTDRDHGWAVGTGGQVLAYRVITGVPEKLPGVPKRYVLKQNYPNPFNLTTNIEYEVAARSAVSIKVYDVSGREIKELVNSVQEPGVYRLRFAAAGLASGVYYYTLNVGQYSETKQMTLLK